MNDFAAITCYFNPCDYQRRKSCYQRFASGLDQQGVELWTIEAFLPDQTPFVEPGPRVFQVEMSGDDWIWQKERLLNLLLTKLPERITKVAWIDADLIFLNRNWARMAADSLETWSVVQLFDYVYYLGPDDSIIDWKHGKRIASMASVVMHRPIDATNLTVASPGFAWAARRALLQKHGLFEANIDGSCDTVMAASVLGLFNSYIFRQGSPQMNVAALNYGKRLYEDVCGYVGYLPVSLHHIWHGDFDARQYSLKTQRLKELNFDPDRDVVHDPHTGLLQWSTTARQELRDFMREVFVARKEDG